MTSAQALNIGIIQSWPTYKAQVLISIVFELKNIVCHWINFDYWPAAIFFLQVFAQHTAEMLWYCIIPKMTFKPLKQSGVYSCGLQCNDKEIP